MDVIDTNRFAVYPSVVRSNSKVTFTVTAKQRCFLPNGSDEYYVLLNPHDSDVIEYHNEFHKIRYDAVTENGVLTFTAQMGAEGAYALKLFLVRNGEEKLRMETEIYALDGDLFALRPLKGDFHTHSWRSDGELDPGSVIADYREYGYDFVTLTDHNRYAPAEEAKEAFKDVKLGFEIINGEEVHTPGSCVHIVNAGSKYSVDDVYIHDPERFEKEWKAKLGEIPEDTPEQYKNRLALAKWSCDSIRNAGGIAIFPHPFWLPKSSDAYNVSTEFCRILLKSGYFDAYELVGGVNQERNNQQLAIWQESNPSLPIVGSSDAHSHNRLEFRYHYTVVFAAKNESGSIIDAVRNGYSVPVFMYENSVGEQYQCFGSLRLVSYANFLLKRYFPRTARICRGEGAAMHRYLAGEEDPALLDAMQNRVKDFYERFFGVKPPVIPSAETLEFENKWRGEQLKSPDTRGSLLEPSAKSKTPSGRNI